MDENSNYIDSLDDGAAASQTRVEEEYHPSQEAFECNVNEIKHPDSESVSFEKIAEDSASMHLDLTRADPGDESSLLAQLRDMDLKVKANNPQFADLYGSSNQSDGFMPLPMDFSKLSFEQREQLLAHLQTLQNGSACPKNGDPLFSRTRVASSDESMGTLNSLSNESIVLPSDAYRRNQRSAYVWNGELPPRNYVHPIFSCKIFVGGVPWDITEDALLEAFCPYGDCRVEWPGKEPRYSRSQLRDSPRGKVTGYVYMIFEQERSVKALLQDCSQEFGSAGEWYFKLKARRNQTTEIRQVQVIPWVVSDASYVGDPGCRLDPKKTVFVGALHGMITAHVLYSIMEELYGNVVFVGIDTDKYKYPIGSGRVTFRSHSSYFRAIESAFLEIKTSKFGKKVQIDPFLEDVPCMICDQVSGPYFCRDRSCFRYYCQTCWQARHGSSSGHRPLMRNAPRVPSALEETDRTYLQGRLPPHGSGNRFGTVTNYSNRSSYVAASGQPRFGCDDYGQYQTTRNTSGGFRSGLNQRNRYF